MILLGLAAQAQTKPQNSDSSKITNSSADAPDDAEFSGYEHITKEIEPPKATHSPDPDYPELPSDSDQRGIVVMLVGVNAKGHVQPVRVLRSTGPEFQKSAVATVKTWRFKPAKRDGKAVPVQLTVEMLFRK